MLTNVNGNTILQDDKYSHRWNDGWGPGIVKYVPDQGIPTASSELIGWTSTETGTNTTVNSVAAGSLLTVTTGSTDFNGYSSQLLGSAFAAVTSKPFYFGGKFTIDEATQNDFLFGLCGVDTTLTAASSAHAIAVSAGGFFFSKLDAVTAIKFNVYAAGTPITSIDVGTMTTGAHTYECMFDGEFVNVYFDGVCVGRSNSSIPATVATPSYSVRAGASSAIVNEIGWMKFIQSN